MGAPECEYTVVFYDAIRGFGFLLRKETNGGSDASNANSKIGGRASGTTAESRGSRRNGGKNGKNDIYFNRRCLLPGGLVPVSGETVHATVVDDSGGAASAVRIPAGGGVQEYAAMGRRNDGGNIEKARAIVFLRKEKYLLLKCSDGVTAIGDTSAFGSRVPIGEELLIGRIRSTIGKFKAVPLSLSEQIDAAWDEKSAGTGKKAIEELRRDIADINDRIDRNEDRVEAKLEGITRGIEDLKLLVMQSNQQPHSPIRKMPKGSDGGVSRRNLDRSFAYAIADGPMSAHRDVQGSISGGVDMDVDAIDWESKFEEAAKESVGKSGTKMQVMGDDHGKQSAPAEKTQPGGTQKHNNEDCAGGGGMKETSSNGKSQQGGCGDANVCDRVVPTGGRGSQGTGGETTLSALS
jgi:hypothetical protein